MNPKDCGLKFKTTSARYLPYVYEKTGSDSQLRKLTVGWCAFNMAGSRFLEKPDHFPQKMLLESAKVLVEHMPENAKEMISREKNMADYEVEEPGEAA
jgi:hypothetical protein